MAETIESFELVRAGETCWSDECDPDGLVLMLRERDLSGEDEGGTRLATFSSMGFMDSLGPRLAKLCLETAQAELKAGPPRRRGGWPPAPSPMPASATTGWSATSTGSTRSGARRATGSSMT
ncbi:hypothetical protein [Methylorubrum thiocyanatum]|uniref:hypothetical protein n=1 Tax=Methylorubrum thiocyanatum TaxID=47958 RepID=UPI0035C79F60